MKNVNPLIADPKEQNIDAAAHFLAEMGVGVDSNGHLTRADYRRQQKQKKTTYQYTAEQIEQIRIQTEKKTREEIQRRVCPACRMDIQRDYDVQLEDLKLTCLNLVLAASLKILWRDFGFRANPKMTGRLQRYASAMIDMVNNDPKLSEVINEVEEMTGIELVVRSEDGKTYKKYNSEGRLCDPADPGRVETD